MIDYTNPQTALESALRDTAAEIELDANMNLAVHLNPAGAVNYTVSGYIDGSYCTAGGETAAEALADFRMENPTGAALIAKKREQAKALLAEAHKLEIESQS